MAQPLTDSTSGGGDTDNPTAIMCLVISKDSAYAASHPRAAAVCKQTGGRGTNGPTINPGAPPVGTPTIPGIIGGITGATGWVSDILNALDPALQWLRNPGRIFKLFIGVGIIFGALLLLITPEIVGAAKDTAHAAVKGAIPS